MSSIVISGDSSGSITLAAPSVAGINTITLPASTGTVQINNGPTFSAYANTSQTVPNGTGTKVVFQGTYWNIGSCYDASTNYRFTPTVAGYYQINAGIGIGSNTAGERQLSIYKNGSEFKRGTDCAGTGASPYQLNVSGIVYCNGSTDYVEIWCFLNSGSSQNIGGGGGYIPATYFDGCMIRSA